MTNTINNYESTKYPVGKGNYSCLATGPNVQPIISIGTTCNNGDTEATRDFLAELGYTSITIIKIK